MILAHAGGGGSLELFVFVPVVVFLICYRVARGPRGLPQKTAGDRASRN